MEKEYINKILDMDLILDSFKPLKEIEKMSAQAMNINITKKLEQIVDLLRHTLKGQKTAEDLTIKEKNFKLIKDLLDNYRNGRGLSKGDMLYCNKVWKRYSGQI